MEPSTITNDTFHIAIIGAGITGINLALGLQARNVSFTLYERHSEIRDIGAGIGFSPNAERAMSLLHPEILTAYKRVANPNVEDYFHWVDGYDSDELIYKLHVGKDGFQGGRRSDILEAWATLIRPTSVVFSKNLADILHNEICDVDGNKTTKLILSFTDGTTTTADAVIGCDGIHSRVRTHVCIPDSANIGPKPIAQYTGKFCYRALAPMPAALSAIGEGRALARCMYTGPGAHVLTYPVANNTLLNILAVIEDPSETWPHPHTTCLGSKAEAATAFEQWHPRVRQIIDLMPEQMDKWGIFDMKNSSSTGFYNRRRMCVAGDAAHAAGPHLGAGAGMGIEDALVLAELLAEVDRRVKETAGKTGSDGGGSVVDGVRDGLVKNALWAYSNVRFGRTMDVVCSTRRACDLFHWRSRSIYVSRDSQVFGPTISQMFHEVWDYNVERMVESAKELLDDQTRAGY
ncbi:FAD/NAD(P)-binding domain-containing protein [Parathielavia appendiculata]|uniref:FAD/NAD(P)-binding domain-containing protein n=1 Tax=Parathielavia appendiculata TaxID=2587402 RepID=A0AAN6TVX2_9PEZI|nr:FAD/NAD(P)-binding domain-containing protein [Parathielavia appendiculata]